MFNKFLVLVLSVFIMASCAAQPTNQTVIIPIPKHPDTLQDCRERFTGENLQYYESYSSVYILEDFFNLKALKLIDVNGQLHIINELELPNYECTKSIIP